MCSLLWLLLHGVATADEAGPVCPSAVPVRVACFGDSLTAGDAKFDGYAKVQQGSRLGSDSVFSRGSYPRVLAGLLGPRFQVQAFAKSGMPMTELLPSACVVPGNDNASRVELVPHAAPSDYASATAAVARCHEALDLPPVLQAKAHGGDTRMAWRGDGRHPLLQAVVSSRPHIVLLLLGTNDAGELSYMNHIRPWYIATSTVHPQGMSTLACYRQKSGTGHAHVMHARAGESHYERYGKTGAPTALAHVVAALMRSGSPPSASPSSASPSSASPSPLVYVLDPPLLMAEPSAAPQPCFRMHACSYHPSLPCWRVSECVTCIKGDQVQSGGWPGNRPPAGQKESPWKSVEGKCIRADLLKLLRSRLGAVAVGGARGQLRHANVHAKHRAYTPSGHVDAHDAHDAHAAACAAGAVMPAAPQLSQSMPSTWRQYTGPIHLNTIGSAHIACLVHRGLFRRCAAQCGGNLSAQMASRHELFCERFDQLRREEPLPTQALDELEHRLHALGRDGEVMLAFR